MDNSSTKEEEMNEELMLELSKICDELGGTIQETTTIDHSGRTSNKIIIEYNVQHKEK